MHASLLALYGLGGWLVAAGLMPIRVLLSAIGFTFSLVFATQGCVQTFSEARRVLVCVRRCALVTSIVKTYNRPGFTPPSHFIGGCLLQSTCACLHACTGASRLPALQPS